MQKHRRGLRRNVMGLCEHFDTDAGASGYAASSDFMTLNSRCTTISFKNFSVNGCKTMSTPSPYFPVLKSHSGHTTVLPSWFTRPLRVCLVRGRVAPCICFASFFRVHRCSYSNGHELQQERERESSIAATVL